MKGHTYSILDQSFSTLIGKLHQYAIYTVSSLLLYMRFLLGKYNVIDCREIFCLWDFKAWLEPHMNTFRGYATSQFGDGMHEFLMRKDESGVVRIYLRKSSQASTWVPEGP
eukprot:2727291-Pleurochrysis_carterae.AAC.1